jgi:hypothetical protein
LVTVLNLAKRGFFIPYRYAGRLPGPGARTAYPAAEARLAGAEAQFSALLESMNRYQTALDAIGEEPPPAPRWAQDWFPRLDAAAAYTLVRRERPGRIVEVGSGHSTRFLARAVADEGLACRITAIDPAPRADLSRLDVELVRAAVPETGDRPFLALEAGDFLMIDSSHILMPGSDAASSCRAATRTTSTAGFCPRCRPVSWCISMTCSCPTTIRRSGTGAVTASSWPSSR